MKIKATKRGFNILNLVLFLSILWSSTAISQVSPRAAGDSTGRPGDVHIIHADRLGFKKMTDSSQIRFASGKVEIRQNTTLFYCDSVAINSVTRIMEAFGHVHINDNDSINIFSDFMRYRGQERTAYLKNNVRLTDGKGTLTTSELDYDLNTKIAVYGKQGKLVSGKSVLTSQAGTYYGDT
ncbi:MAG TPA: OstA-like protein, partial [Arachidicoccus sp.]|nr:OstA-like protein [Arachidicoccus sp.]